MFAEISSELGDKKYRVKQLEHAVFRELVENVEEITVFPKELREKLKEKPLFTLTPQKVVQTADGRSEKALFKTADGHLIESVLMRHVNRNTVCVSSQIGCSCACVFCATGKLGLIRNLTAQEIIEQLLFWARRLKKECFAAKIEFKPKSPPHLYRIRNVVFMGMGEPLLNLDNVLAAIQTMNDDNKLGIGARHITISTVGIIPQIKKLADLGMQINLAVSLHIPDDELRSEIIPQNKIYPLRDLLPALWAFSDKTLRRIFFEYTVIKDVNDSPTMARKLGELLKGHLAHVNFIPLNENPGVALQKPQTAKIHAMQKILLDEYGIYSTVRTEFGDEIAGACGQLAGKEEEGD